MTENHKQVKVAVAAYPITWFDHWTDYANKLTRWVDQAVEQGARLLVFPEYGAMELASLGDEPVASDLQAQIDFVSRLHPEIMALHLHLARSRQCHILAASHPLRLDDNRVVNRACLFGPEGLLGHQDKLIMTRFEREQWFIQSGQGMRVFDTALGRIGILICYDSEFPLLARQMAEQQVDILLVPSCTDTLAGYWRVRVGAMARALECQCYVVQSPTVGDALWSASVDVNVGTAAIYGPPDYGFPPTGVITEGELNQPGWIYATLDLTQVAKVRASGQVLNYQHWPEQEQHI